MNKNDIKNWLKSYSIKNYTIKDDLSVDVHETVNLTNKRLESLPFKFDKILGNFMVGTNFFRNLDNFPNYISGEFSCRHNRLENLKGCPTYIGKTFDCSFNYLVTLKGMPEHIYDGFYCNNNELTSLYGCASKIDGIFNCSDNKIYDLEYCPSYVGKDFICSQNKIKTLKYYPEIVGENFNCSYNDIVSLEDFNCQFGKSFIHADREKIKELSNFYIARGFPYPNMFTLTMTKEEMNHILLHKKLTKEIENTKQNKSKQKI